MCYDKTYLTRRIEFYIKRYAETAEDIKFLKDQLNQFSLAAVYHASGFDHPLVPVITSRDKRIGLYSWGLIPNWIKSAADAVKISNRTINARAETMFEKPAFRESARERRCLIMADGFFEHHHKGGKTYPYHIRLKGEECMTMAGLWDEWTDPSSGMTRRTYTVVTTRANAMLARIHNNPKLEEGPRMPLILPKEMEWEWLKPIHEKADQDLIQSLVRSFDEKALESFSVKRLRGKEAVGNIPYAVLPHRYAELEEQQGSLF